MAASITTQTDVLEYGLITENEIENLTTDRMKADNWATLHKRAWTKVLNLIALQPQFQGYSSISDLESDLTYTTELTVATVFMVLHYAYAQSEFMSEEAQKRAGLYWERAVKELNEVRLTVGGVVTDRSSYAYRRARRV